LRRWQPKATVSLHSTGAALAAPDVFLEVLITPQVPVQPIFNIGLIVGPTAATGDLSI